MGDGERVEGVAVDLVEAAAAVAMVPPYAASDPGDPEWGAPPVPSRAGGGRRAYLVDLQGPEGGVRYRVDLGPGEGAIAADAPTAVRAAEAALRVGGIAADPHQWSVSAVFRAGPAVRHAVRVARGVDAAVEHREAYGVDPDDAEFQARWLPGDGGAWELEGTCLVPATPSPYTHGELASGVMRLVEHYLAGRPLALPLGELATMASQALGGGSFERSPPPGGDGAGAAEAAREAYGVAAGATRDAAGAARGLLRDLLHHLDDLGDDPYDAAVAALGAFAAGRAPRDGEGDLVGEPRVALAVLVRREGGAEVFGNVTPGP